MTDAVRVELWNLAAPVVRTFGHDEPGRRRPTGLRVGYLALRLAGELGLPPPRSASSPSPAYSTTWGPFSLASALTSSSSRAQPGKHASAGGVAAPPVHALCAALASGRVPFISLEHGEAGPAAGTASRRAPTSHLADRTAVSLMPRRRCSGQVPQILETIASDGGGALRPAHVEALARARQEELRVARHRLRPDGAGLHAAISGGGLDLDLGGLLEFARSSAASSTSERVHRDPL